MATSNRFRSSLKNPAVDANPPNKHQQRTEATKHKLLQAAFRIFARDGFEAARIDEIATAAGYTRGAFYAHFQSKEDLFFAMLETESRRNIERVSKALESCKIEAERVQTLREYYVKRLADRQWSVLILEFKLYALRHPRLRAKLAEMYRSIRTKIKLEGLNTFKCPPESERMMKVVLQTALTSIALETAYDPANISEAEAEDVLRRLFDFVITTFVGRDAAR
jgi:AcrR family transcriptional regulator